MNPTATERLINRTRFVFAFFFVLTGISSWRSGSDPRVYLAIFACSAAFLVLAAPRPPCSCSDAPYLAAW
jgi:hypothetical protein